MDHRDMYRLVVVVLQTRRLQRRFADGLIAEEIGDLREPWMIHSDAALNDDQLLEIVQQANNTNVGRLCVNLKLFLKTRANLA